MFNIRFRNKLLLQEEFVNCSDIYRLEFRGKKGKNSRTGVVVDINDGHPPCHQKQHARWTLCCHPRLCLWTNMKAGTLSWALISTPGEEIHLLYYLTLFNQ